MRKKRSDSEREPEGGGSGRSKAERVDDPGAEHGTRLSAVEIHENIVEPAEEELERSTLALLFSAVAAGLVIGFSFLASAYAFMVAPPPYEHAAAAAAYPLGFIFVILARNELFTENTLEPIVPLLEQRTSEKLIETIRLWAVLLVGNLVGATALALALAHTPAVTENVIPHLTRIAEHSTNGDFWLVLYRALFAGWLLAMLTWLLAATRATGAQIALIWMVTAPIEAFGFHHSIAESVEAFYLAAEGTRGWLDVLGTFTLPAIIGNAIGGVVLVAILNYGQVAPQIDERRRRRRFNRHAP